MAALPETVSKAWDNREGPVVLATVDANGLPNAIYVTCVKKFDDDKLAIADNYFSKTRANIQARSKGAILFITKEEESFQVKGSIDYQTRGHIFNDMRDYLDAEYPVHAVAVLNVEAVYSGSEQLV